MLKAIRRLFKRLLVAALTAFCIFAAAMVYFAFACKQGPASPLAASPSPPERQKLKDYLESGFHPFRTLDFAVLQLPDHATEPAAHSHRCDL